MMIARSESVGFFGRLLIEKDSTGERQMSRLTLTWAPEGGGEPQVLTLMLVDNLEGHGLGEMLQRAISTPVKGG